MNNNDPNLYDLESMKVEKLINHLLILVVSTFVWSCAMNPDSAEVTHSAYHASIAVESVDDKLILYSELRDRIGTKQNDFSVEYPAVDEEHKQGLVVLARKYITSTLCDSIWSHWYGTDWDFYGTTETPGKGNIACGYFVTTTLKHVGYNIDRVTLAQQAASVIITTMCGKGKTKIIGNNNIEGLVAYMKEQADGVYICGLDNHVGFIQKQGDKIYFVHSSGLSNQLKVMKEEIQNSNAIQYSQAYYVGSLTGNQSNLIKWIKKEKIDLVK